MIRYLTSAAFRWGPNGSHSSAEATANSHLEKGFFALFASLGLDDLGKFMNRFKARLHAQEMHASVSLRRLQGCDLST